MLMTKIYKAHPQFSNAYPIVLRYMCEMLEYSPKALRLFLMKIKEHPYRSETEYIASQADYVVMLYKARHPKWNASDVKTLRANIVNVLTVEHDSFKSNVKKIDEQIKKENRVLHNRRREEISKYLASTALTPQTCVAMSVKSELSPRAVDVDALLDDVEPAELKITGSDLLA